MVESKTCNNLGTPRTQNWPIITKFLIRLIHGEFIFQGIRLFRIFQILFFPRFWVCQDWKRGFQISVVDILQFTDLTISGHHDFHIIFPIPLY